jgi:phosphoglycerol transferase MdoB-like AlkP superfamily enzyme
LPQDIHVAAITQHGGGAIDDVDDGRFYAPVASRLRALDRCFGEFIEQLKVQQLYDNSIVILTADHGDSLGEGGRMGHAYTIFPEIVQIPLIVHLPSSLGADLVPEDEGPVFSTDITPTLYALLGTPPAQPRGFFGRPLYRARGQRPRPIESAPVIASSYGAVYGALVANQKTLYIVDTINAREHTYDLDGSGAGVPVSTTAAIRREGQGAIRGTVEAIAEFYKFAGAR